MIISNKLKTVLLKDIKPFKNNVKIHSGEQIERIKKSIEDNGYVNPISIDKNNEIVMGTGRYLALMKMDPKKEIEVIDLSDLTPQKVKKLRIIDNQLSNLSPWDKDNLAMELKNIYTDIDDGYEKIMDEMGFDESLLDELNKKDQVGDEPKKDTAEKSGSVKHKYTCPECGFTWSKGDE